MRFTIKLLSRLPLGALYIIGSVLHGIATRLFGYRRKVVDKNLRIIFPGASDTERRAIARRFFRFFAENAVESIKNLSMSGEELARRVTVENPDLISPYLERRQPILFLTLHQGNLEWVVQRVGQFVPCPVAGIYKPLHNPTMDALVRDGRARYGEPIPMKNAGREIVRQRKAFRCMLMVADQSPISREKRYWRRFFSRPAPFYYGPQTIAEATGNPVVFIHPRRLRRGFYSIRFEVLAEPPYNKGGTDILDRFIAACERSIREQPESWWLSNKKWKSPKPWEQVDLQLSEASQETSAHAR